MFIANPIGPVVLIVSISTSATITDMAAAATGPNASPPITIIESFGSKVRKDIEGISGTLPTATATKASAQSIPVIQSCIIRLRDVGLFLFI